MVFRFVWYRFGLFLYSASSFFLSLSTSFLFALFMIVEMALWHRAGMSSMLGGSVSWSVEAWVGGWVMIFWGPESCGCGFGWSMVCSLLVLSRVAALRSFVRRLICLLSELERGVCSFSGSGVGLVCEVGQFFCASSWYVFSMVMMWSAAWSILFVVVVRVSVSVAR